MDTPGRGQSGLQESMLCGQLKRCCPEGKVGKLSQGRVGPDLQEGASLRTQQ